MIRRAGWPDTSFMDLVGIDVPIVQAPMAGASGSAMAIAVCQAGGLGSLPCAMLDADRIRAEVATIRAQTEGPININFFCHTPAQPDDVREKQWRGQLMRFYKEYGLEVPETMPGAGRAPFDEESCALVQSLRPEVVSFHFGLPRPDLVDRIRSAGCLVMSTATTVAEAEWLEGHGCDAIIAQGYEAGGHRGMFLSEDLLTQTGTLALVPQVVDAVSVPVIVAGGVADGRALVAAIALGGAAAQIGTAYLFTSESLISGLHRRALHAARDIPTALTNVFSGRAARSLVNRAVRELGPMSDAAPAFPTAGMALAPLKTAAEAQGEPEFSSLWSGQAAALGRAMGAGELTRCIAQEAAQRLREIADRGP